MKFNGLTLKMDKHEYLFEHAAFIKDNGLRVKASYENRVFTLIFENEADILLFKLRYGDKK